MHRATHVRHGRQYTAVSIELPYLFRGAFRGGLVTVYHRLFVVKSRPNFALLFGNKEECSGLIITLNGTFEIIFWVRLFVDGNKHDIASVVVPTDAKQGQNLVTT